MGASQTRHGSGGRAERLRGGVKRRRRGETREAAKKRLRVERLREGRRVTIREGTILFHGSRDRDGLAMDKFRHTPSGIYFAPHPLLSVSFGDLLAYKVTRDITLVDLSMNVSKNRSGVSRGSIGRSATLGTLGLEALAPDPSATADEFKKAMHRYEEAFHDLADATSADGVLNYSQLDSLKKPNFWFGSAAERGAATTRMQEFMKSQRLPPIIFRISNVPAERAARGEQTITVPEFVFKTAIANEYLELQTGYVMPLPLVYDLATWASVVGDPGDPYITYRPWTEAWRHVHGGRGPDYWDAQCIRNQIFPAARRELVSFPPNKNNMAFLRTKDSVVRRLTKRAVQDPAFAVDVAAPIVDLWWTYAFLKGMTSHPPHATDIDYWDVQYVKTLMPEWNADGKGLSSRRASFMYFKQLDTRSSLVLLRSKVMRRTFYADAFSDTDGEQALNVPTDLNGVRVMLSLYSDDDVPGLIYTPRNYLTCLYSMYRLHVHLGQDLERLQGKDWPYVWITRDMAAKWMPVHCVRLLVAYGLAMSKDSDTFVNILTKYLLRLPPSERVKFKMSATALQFANLKDDATVAGVNTLGFDYSKDELQRIRNGIPLAAIHNVIDRPLQTDTSNYRKWRHKGVRRVKKEWARRLRACLLASCDETAAALTGFEPRQCILQ